MAETKLKPQGMDLTADYAYSGAMTFDGTTLVVDDVNNRVGIGTASPAYNLDIAGDFHASSSGIFDGQILAADGGVGAPGMAFSGNPNTGIYRTAEDVMRFATGGVEAMVITAAQVVGFSSSPNITGFGGFTPWTSYTPTFSAGWGTVAIDNVFYRIVGDTMEIRGAFVAGTIAASAGYFTLPSGFEIDSAKLPGGLNEKAFLGLMFNLDAGGNTLFFTTNTVLALYATNPQPARVYVTNRGESTIFNSQNVTEFFISSNRGSFSCSFPVTAV